MRFKRTQGKYDFSLNTGLESCLGTLLGTRAEDLQKTVLKRNRFVFLKE